MRVTTFSGDSLNHVPAQQCRVEDETGAYFFTRQLVMTDDGPMIRAVYQDGDFDTLAARVGAAHAHALFAAVRRGV